MAESTSAQDTRAVFVSNISPNATEKTVSDFFSFCGRIIKLSLRKEPASQDGSQEAVVVFETDSAAKTALLLTNALIVDRPITVVPYTAPADSEQASALPTETPQENITSRPFAAPDSERSKTSVIASLIAAGYVLGTDAAAKAREIDEKHMISLQFKVGAEQVKAKANELDKALHITETANVIKAATLEKAKEVDEKLHISEKVNHAAETVKQQANALATKAVENEVVAKGMDMVKNLSSTLQQSFQQSFQSIRDESMAIVEQKRAQEQHTAGTTVPPTTTTTTSPSTTTTSMDVDATTPEPVPAGDSAASETAL